jgi:hypothetical protein
MGYRLLVIGHIVNKNWLSMTCGYCGRVGPALNDKEAKKEMLKNGVTKFWLW